MGLCARIAYALKGLGLLFLLLVYELFCFAGFLSLSIGLSVLITKGYDYFFAPSTFPVTSQAFAAIYFLGTFSEVHIFCHKACIEPTIAYYDRLYHSSITSTAKIIYVFLFLISYVELYSEFQEVHMSRLPSLTIYHPFERTGHTTHDQWHIAGFLLILAYIVYCTSKLTHYDLIKQLGQLENPASCVHCVVTLGFLIVHFLINILYSVPLLIVGFSVRAYNYSGLSAYLHLTLTAFVSGFVFAVLETRKPFPTRRFFPPFFFHENNNRAKAALSQLLFVLPILTFYYPTSEGKIPPSKFSAANDYIMLFCMAVSCVVLHMTKTLVYIVIDTNIRPIRDRQAQLRLGDEELGDNNNNPPGELLLEAEDALNDGAPGGGPAQCGLTRPSTPPASEGFVGVQVIPNEALILSLDSKEEDSKKLTKSSPKDSQDSEDEDNPGLITIAQDLDNEEEGLEPHELTGESNPQELLSKPEEIIIQEVSGNLNNNNNNNNSEIPPDAAKEEDSPKVEESSPAIPKELEEVVTEVVPVVVPGAESSSAAGTHSPSSV